MKQIINRMELRFPVRLRQRKLCARRGLRVRPVP